MQHTRQRLTRILLSLCCVAVFTSPVLANQTSRLLGTDTSANRDHFTHNIQALEHLLLGPQAEHQESLLPHLGQTDASVDITDYSSASVRAQQLGFTWADTSTWGIAGWEPFTANQHQGIKTALLTPLTDLNFSRIPSDLDSLASRSARWSVCRVAVQETYRYGYYDGVHPYCTLGAPHTLQWDRTTRRWQQPVPLEASQPLPHQHPHFAVLPVANTRTLSAERLLATLVRATQQTRGFAIDHAIDRTDTRWPAHTMGYRLGRLVNTTGIIDFTLHAPADLTLSPTQCQLTFELPGPNASTLPRRLHYLMTPQAYGKTAAGDPRYRCQLEASALKQWLKRQQPQHPEHITDTLGMSDIAFLAVQLHYTLEHINTTPQRHLHPLVQDLLWQIPALQHAIDVAYLRTLPYANEHGTWLSTFFPSYAAQNRALKTLRSLDLAKQPITRLHTLLQAGFRNDTVNPLPHTWQQLPLIAQQLTATTLNAQSLNQLQAQLQTQTHTLAVLKPLLQHLKNATHSPVKLHRQPSVVARVKTTAQSVIGPTHRIQQTLQLQTQNPGEHLAHYHMSIDSGHQLSIKEVPVPAASDTSPESGSIQSYAHDNLQHTAGAIEWILTPVYADGSKAGHSQHSTDLNNGVFNVSLGQRYRLTLKENNEAWSNSSLSLAEGTLEEFIADDQTDNSYFLTFSEYRSDVNLTPRTVPVILHAHHRTHGGRTYDTDLRFSGRFYEPTLWAIQDGIDNTILKATPRPQLSQPLLGIQINAAVENDQLIALDTILALTDTSGRDLKTGPQIAWRLSTCLASHNQDSDACQHTRPLTSLSSEDNNALSFIQRVHLYHLPNITLDNTQPQQLFVRVPQTDKDGNIRGYRQRWYTIFEPQYLSHLYYDQEITQGVDPLLVRPVLWSMLETARQNLQIQEATLNVSSTLAIPTALKQALATYNTDNRFDTIPAFPPGADNNFDKVLEEYNNPTLSYAFGDETEIQDDSLNPIQVPRGLQAPSFIYSSNMLPVGTYQFDMQYTVAAQFGNCINTLPNKSHCIIGNAVSLWEQAQTATTHNLTETVQITVKPPAAPPYPDSVAFDINHTDEPITIAPGIHWQPKPQARHRSINLELPYDLYLWDGHAVSRQQTQSALSKPYPAPKLSAIEQKNMAQVLEDMGYQKATQAIKLCAEQPTKSNSTTNDAACQSFAPGDITALQTAMRPYDHLHATLDSGALVFDLPSEQVLGPVAKIRNAKKSLIKNTLTQCCLVGAGVVGGGVVLVGGHWLYNKLHEVYQFKNLFLSGKKYSAGQYSEFMLGSVADTAYQGRYLKQPTQTVHVYPSPHDWLSIPTFPHLWEENTLYVELGAHDVKHFCVDTGDDSSLGAIKAVHIVEPKNSSAVSGDFVHWELTHPKKHQNKTIRCLDEEATGQLYNIVHHYQDLPVNLNIDVASASGETDTITVKLRNLNDKLTQLFNHAIHRPFIVTEDYAVDNQANRTFQIDFNATLNSIREQIPAYNRDNGDKTAITTTLKQVHFRPMVMLDAKDQVEEASAVTFAIVDGTTHIAIDTDDSATTPTLSLQGHSLLKDHWYGILEVVIELNINGHITTTTQYINTWFYPYLNPRVQFSWESYHSQRPIHENTLKMEFLPNFGQTLDLAWLDKKATNLRSYYVPALERLYTDSEVAEKVKRLVPSYIPATEYDVTTKKYVWLRASNFANMALYLANDLQDPWEGTPGEVFSHHNSDKSIKWVRRVEGCDEQDFTCFQNTLKPQGRIDPLQEKKNLFIGLSAEDASALQAYRDTKTAEPFLTPISTVLLYTAEDFTAQLAVQEKEVYAAFVPQAAWDAFVKDSKIDWEAWKEGIKQYSSKRDKGFANLSNMKYTFSRRLTIPNNNNNNNDEIQENPTPITEVDDDSDEESQTTRIRLTGAMLLDKALLKKKYIENYIHRKLGANNINAASADMEFRNEFDLAIAKADVQCDGKKPFTSREKKYSNAIKPKIFNISSKKEAIQCSFDVYFGPPVKILYDSVAGLMIASPNKISFERSIILDKDTTDIKILVKQSNYLDTNAKTMYYSNFYLLVDGEVQSGAPYTLTFYWETRVTKQIKRVFGTKELNFNQYDHMQGVLKLIGNRIFDYQLIWKETTHVNNSYYTSANFIKPKNKQYVYYVTYSDDKPIPAGQEYLSYYEFAKRFNHNSSVEIQDSRREGIAIGQAFEKTLFYKQARLLKEEIGKKFIYRWLQVNPNYFDNKHIEDRFISGDSFLRGPAGFATLVYIIDAYRNNEPQSNDKFKDLIINEQTQEDSRSLSVEDVAFNKIVGTKLYNRLLKFFAQRPVNSRDMISGIVSKVTYDTTVDTLSQIEAQKDFGMAIERKYPFDVIRYYYNFMLNMDRYLQYLAASQNISSIEQIFTNDFQLEQMEISEQLREVLQMMQSYGNTSEMVLNEGVCKTFALCFNEKTLADVATNTNPKNPEFLKALSGLADFIEARKSYSINEVQGFDTEYLIGIRYNKDFVSKFASPVRNILKVYSDMSGKEKKEVRALFMGSIKSYCSSDYNIRIKFRLTPLYVVNQHNFRLIGKIPIGGVKAGCLTPLEKKAHISEDFSNFSNYLNQWLQSVKYPASPYL